jgi:hypothetical protein
METVTQMEDQLIQPEIIWPLPAGTVDKAYNLRDDQDETKTAKYPPWTALPCPQGDQRMNVKMAAADLRTNEHGYTLTKQKVLMWSIFGLQHGKKLALQENNSSSWLRLNPDFANQSPIPSHSLKNEVTRALGQPMRMFVANYPLNGHNVWISEDDNDEDILKICHKLCYVRQYQ